MTSKLPQLCTRISLELKTKFIFVCTAEDRTKSQQLRYVIKRYVAAFEKEHGDIKVD